MVYCAENVTGLKLFTEDTNRCEATEILNSKSEFLNKFKILNFNIQNSITVSFGFKFEIWIFIIVWDLVLWI